MLLLLTCPCLSDFEISVSSKVAIFMYSDIHLLQVMAYDRSKGKENTVTTRPVEKNCVRNVILFVLFKLIMGGLNQKVNHSLSFVVPLKNRTPSSPGRPISPLKNGFRLTKEIPFKKAVSLPSIAQETDFPQLILTCLSVNKQI